MERAGEGDAEGGDEASKPDVPRSRGAFGWLGRLRIRGQPSQQDQPGRVLGGVPDPKPNRAWGPSLAIGGIVAFSAIVGIGSFFWLQPEIKPIAAQPDISAAIRACGYDEAEDAYRKASQERNAPEPGRPRIARSREAKAAEDAKNRKSDAAACEERLRNLTDLEAQWAAANAARNGSEIALSQSRWAVVEFLALLMTIGAALWAAAEANNSAKIAKQALDRERAQETIQEARHNAQMGLMQKQVADAESALAEARASASEEGERAKKTLVEAQMANRIALDSREMQLRAYVAVTSSVLFRENDFAPLVAVIAYTNTGQTPAKDLHIAKECIVSEEETIAVPEPQSFVKASDLGPGRGGKMTLNLPDSWINQDARGALFIIGVVRYRDIFGVSRKTTFSLMAKNHKLGDLSVCQGGNEIE